MSEGRRTTIVDVAREAEVSIKTVSRVFNDAPNAVGNAIEFLGWQMDALTITCILLFIGAMGKSAQLFLHTNPVSRITGTQSDLGRIVVGNRQIHAW